MRVLGNKLTAIRYAEELQQGQSIAYTVYELEPDEWYVFSSMEPVADTFKPVWQVG